MNAQTLKEIYKVAQIPVTDAEIAAQVKQKLVVPQIQIVNLFNQISAADAKGTGSVDFEDFLSVMNKVSYPL